MPDYFRHSVAKRASDVITQTNSDKRNGMVKDLTLFQARRQVFRKQILKQKNWRPFSSYFSQITLMLSDSRRIPIICILFLDFAHFVIKNGSKEIIVITEFKWSSDDYLDRLCGCLLCIQFMMQWQAKSCFERARRGRNWTSMLKSLRVNSTPLPG